MGKVWTNAAVPAWPSQASAEGRLISIGIEVADRLVGQAQAENGDRALFLLRLGVGEGMD
jgi:hypothetical protein